MRCGDQPVDKRAGLEAFLAGERPERIPYTVYWWLAQEIQHDPEFLALVRRGLLVTHHVPPWKGHTPGLEWSHHEFTEGGKAWLRAIQKTPVGEISATWSEGWQTKYWLETPDDYRVMTWIARHTHYEPEYEAVRRKQAEVGADGAVLLFLGRTPMQEIIVDLAGLEQYSHHLVEYADEVHELYEALLAGFARRVELTAAAPGSFVAKLENFTAESLGPQRYEQWLAPVYRRFFPVLQAAGKIVGVHYDGRTRACRQEIAAAPFDLVESLTEPPEGDQTLRECRAAWPGKLFWCNINVSDYQLPPDQLRQRVAGLVRDGAVQGSRLAFEISEHLQANWRQSIPVVLQVLEELST